MRGLRHFGRYSIFVFACRDFGANPQDYDCSPDTMNTVQVLRTDSADDIPAGTFRYQKIASNDSSATVRLMWQEPPQPNGVVLTYQIEYKRVDVPNVSFSP